MRRIKGVERADESIWIEAGAQPVSFCFEQVFRTHYPRVVSVLVRLTGNRGQAEELASDVFCKLSKRAGVTEEHLIAWIYRTATNAGLDALKANERRMRREPTYQVATSESGDALADLIAEERRSRVRGILGTLKPRDAQLLLLRAEKLAYRSIAETLGIAASSVGTLLARAEAAFEKQYRVRYGEEK